MVRNTSALRVLRSFHLSRSKGRPDESEGGCVEQRDRRAVGAHGRLVERATGRSCQAQGEIERRRPIVDVELERLREVDHHPNHLPVCRLAVGDVFHRSVLPCAVLLRDPARAKNLSDADTETWDEGRDRCSRQHHRQQRPLADAQHKLAAANMNRVRVSITESGGRRHERRGQRRAEALREARCAAKREH